MMLNHYKYNLRLHVGIIAVILLLSGFELKAQLPQIDSFSTNFPGILNLRPGITSFSPGTDIELWLRSDQPHIPMNDPPLSESVQIPVPTMIPDTLPRAGVTNNMNNILLWYDISGKDRNFAAYLPVVNNQPFPTIEPDAYLVNFHQSVNFRGGRQKLNQYGLNGTGQVHFINRTRAFYIFYVSETSSTSGFGAVFSFNSGNGNYYGWNAGTPRFYTGSTAFTHQGNGKMYGIHSVMIPNVTTSGVWQQSYFNGVLNTFNNARQLNISAGTASIGSSSTANNSNDLFNGSVQEIIVLSGPLGTYLPANDIQRINSYLALKYGITLETGNYLSPSGAVYWDRSGYNSGFNNNIFGLAREDISGLYVKQAKSTDNPTLTAYAGTLTVLNSQNTTGIMPGTGFANNTYIMFGSNALVGTGNYDVPIDQPYMNNGFTLDRKIEYRFKETFRVQTTGVASATLNLRINQPSADILFVSSRLDFDPSYTRAYPLTNGTATNVLVNNHDYIMYAKRETLTPSPFNCTLVWKLDANDLNLTTGQRVVNWGSFTEAATANQPYMNRNLNVMNFQPSVQFAGRAYMWANQLQPSLANTSYYFFAVSEHGGASVVNRGATFNINNNTYQVIYNLNGTGYNRVGWYRGNPFVTNGDTTKRDVFPSDKPFGVTMSARPNSMSADAPQALALNASNMFLPPGLIREATPVGTPTYSIRQMIGAANNGNTSNTNSFVGNIQEMILYSASNDTPMDFATAQKIQSYLAMKYGFTLIVGDYIASDGTIIWSRDFAKDDNGVTYDQMIFGIGRHDDAASMGLDINQKQARAYNNPHNSPFAVFVGTLDSLNKNNTAVLTNNTFLTFSADRSIRSFIEMMQEDMYQDNTLFRNGTVLPEGVNFTTAKFKAQTNVSSGMTVNFQNMTVLTDCYLMVSQNPGFPADETDLYPFEASQSISNLTVRKGDYLRMMAHGEKGPGGIFEGLRMWMMPDSAFITFASAGQPQVTRWRDYHYSTNGIEYYQNTQIRQPVYAPDDPRMNYHPSIIFNDQNSGGTQCLIYDRGIMSVNAPQEYSFFTLLNNDFLYNVNSTGRRSYPIGFGGTTVDAPTRYPAFGIQVDDATNMGVGRMVDDGTGGSGVGDAVNGKIPMFRANATTIMSHQVFKNQKIRYEFDGYAEEVMSTAVGNSSRMATYGSVLGGASLPQRYLHGPFGEIFAFERELDQNERNTIYSYLGLKYGITIDLDKSNETVNFDYILDNGTVVWPGNNPLFQKYHYCVASVVRDDGTELENKRSHSTSDDGVVFMGLVGKDDVKNSDGDWPWKSFDRDHSALTWGNDSISLDEQVIFDDLSRICGDFDFRLRRTWLAYNNAWKYSVPDDPASSHIMDSVRMIVRYGGAAATYNNNYQAYMLISTEPVTDTNEWIKVIPGNFVNGQHEFDYIFEDEFTYFTFGFKEIGSGCPTCGFDIPKMWSFANRTSWTNGGGASQSYDLGDGFSATVSVEIENAIAPNTRLTNQTPAAYTNNTLRITRGGNSRNAIETSIKPVVPAAMAFEIYGLGPEGTRYDRIEIIGKCNGVEYKPRLNYTTTKARSSYTIEKNVATGRRMTKPAYTNVAGRMLVGFPHPMEEVIIRYTLAGANSNAASGQIGIGPITFSCPPPMPSPNEDGLIFVYDAPTETFICSEIPYEFTFGNTSCNPKLAAFTNELPAGMHWKSVIFPDTFVLSPGTRMNDFAGKRLLQIDSLLIPGGSFDLPFTGIAEIDDDNLLIGDRNYCNDNAWIYYTRIVGGVETPNSLQALKKSNPSVTTVCTYITGDPEDRNIEPLEFSLIAGPGCLMPNDSVKFTFKVVNKDSKQLPPNLISYGDNITLDIVSEEEYPIIISKIEISGAWTLPSTPTENDPGESAYASWYNESIVIPPGEHILTFWVKTPAVLPPAFDEEGNPVYDSKGNPVVLPMDVSVTLAFSGDPCVAAAFADGDCMIHLEPCGSSKIVTNKNVTSR